MSKVYLFDWGDTLMVDFPNQPGHMKNWVIVEEVSGAFSTLQKLSAVAKVFVATGSIGTSSALMQSAFVRTSLSPFISGYFCPDNIGYEKPSKEFYNEIAAKVECNVEDITMVGDNLTRDILPALAVGMSAIWLNLKHQDNAENVIEVKQLTELISKR